MRLEAIERPSSPLMKLAYWLTARRLGKVMTPMKVIYARWPKLLFAQRHLYPLMESDAVMSPRLRGLVSTWVSSLNGCSFCEDLHRYQAEGEVDDALFVNLSEFRTADHFSAQERAALAYAEEVTLYKKVDDATFAAVKAHFDEQAIVKLAWYVAMVNYLNMLAAPLGIESDEFCQLRLESAG